VATNGVAVKALDRGRGLEEVLGPDHWAPLPDKAKSLAQACGRKACKEGNAAEREARLGFHKEKGVMNKLLCRVRNHWARGAPALELWKLEKGRI
jgi:hypothetical protein